MSKEVLIIGSGAAGMQAAVDLAEVGVRIHLVDSSPFLGNMETKTLPDQLVNRRLLELTKHPNVVIWPSSVINRVQQQSDGFSVELRTNPRYVDVNVCTACGDCIEVCPVNAPGKEHKVIHIEDGQPGCVVIEKHGVAPCTNTCPGGVHVQGYVALIAQGRFQEAIDLIREAIPFPGICGRVCTHPCEINCRRSEVDQPVAVRLLKRFVSDWEYKKIGGIQAPGEKPQPNGKRVAIVGAGPGGMAVADQLIRAGYQVTVFDKLPIIGGMMAIGIPEYRLPHDVILREYQHIQDLGVEVKLKTSIGPEGDHTLDDLFNLGYDAVCLAIGAHCSQDLNIQGEDLPGVVHGLEILKAISLSQQLEHPTYNKRLEKWLKRGAETRAIVLGGGNTAMDVSRSLRRFGIKDVRILYRRTRDEMPAMPEEVEDAEHEGVQIEYLISPVRILGSRKDGVSELECARMKLGEPDSSGRRRPVPIADSEFVIDADMVVLAIGQKPELEILGEGSRIAVTQKERINVADISFMTSRPSVFAVGDAVTNDKMAVIEAIGMGKRAAAAIDAYLCGGRITESRIDSRAVPVAQRTMSEEELVQKPRTAVRTIAMKSRLTSFDEVERGFSASQAKAEALRCLACGPCSECQACVYVCKAGAIIHEQPEAMSEFEVGAVIYADAPARFNTTHLVKGDRVLCVSPESPLHASAAAQRVMVKLGLQSPEAQSKEVEKKALGARIGVFVCQCGGEISSTVDTEAVTVDVGGQMDVIHTGILPFACNPTAASVIEEAITTNELNRIVLAACSCCSLEQICDSCTYQRMRCKDNLGIFRNHLQDLADRVVDFVFVNIREQCAWVHADRPQEATLKAISLIRASLAGAHEMSHPTVMFEPISPSAVILGSGKAGQYCHSALEEIGISAQRSEELPKRIQRNNGSYLLTLRDYDFQASLLVLAPQNTREAKKILSLFGEERWQPRSQPVWGGLNTQRPGIFLTSTTTKEPEITGRAVASRAAAWLKHNPSLHAAVVNASLCRGCCTCVEICEFGAPELKGNDPDRTACINPFICTGCGTCAAHCPSNAITAGCPGDHEIEAMLKAMLLEKELG